DVGEVDHERGFERDVLGRLARGFGGLCGSCRGRLLLALPPPPAATAGTGHHDEDQEPQPQAPGLGGRGGLESWGGGWHERRLRRWMPKGCNRRAGAMTGF